MITKTTRRPRKKKTIDSDKVYFSSATEDAIVLYNETEDLYERDRIFQEKIAYPLDKLAENVINRFKFPYINNSFDDTKRHVVSFLVTNLSKYSKDKGKAFSYFSVIAKNYLIFHNNKGYKEAKMAVTFSETTEDGTECVCDAVSNLPAPDEHAYDDVREFVKLTISYWEKNVNRHFKKRRDIDIANAVIELFRRADTIENFNKKALYLMIREITDCNTGNITKVVNKMRQTVLEHMQEFYNDGTVNNAEEQFFSY